MNSLLDLRNNLRNVLLDCLFNDSLNYLSHWLYLHSFCVDINWHCSFDVDWDWHFNWLENNSINKLYFSFLNWNSDYFIDMHCYRNLLLFNNHSFFDNLMNLNISSCLQIFHQYLISRQFNSAIHCQINNFLHLYFYRDLLLQVLWNIMNNWRHLNWYLDYFFHNFFNYLRNLNYFLNDSRNNNNFFNNFLDFNTLGNFNYFFNNFFSHRWNFFDSFIV